MSILSSLKTAFLSLIPGMVLWRIDKIQNDMDYSNSQKRIRASIRIVILSVCFLFGSVLGGFIAPIIVTPLAGVAGSILGSLSVGLILAEWGAILSKHALRLISWMQHTRDTTILNPTYPAKFTVNYESDEKPSAKAEEAMKKLYEAKQKIKNNPSCYFRDLSFEERENCEAINYAVKQLRITGSIYRIFRPESFGIDRNDPTLRAKFSYLEETAVDHEISLIIRATDAIFFFKEQIKKNHLDFLSKTILEPNTDEASVCLDGFNFLPNDPPKPSRYLFKYHLSS